MTPDALTVLRCRLGYTVEEFADRVGVGPEVIRGIERGTRQSTLLIDNALAWIDHTNGAPPPGYCRTCDGVGTVRRTDPDRPHLKPRVRCEACDGQGGPRHQLETRP